MRRVWLFLPLAAVVLATGCDDTEFSNGSSVELSGAEGWEGVLEIFDVECLACHGAGSPAGGLDLETDPCGAIVDVDAVAGTGLLVSPGDSQASVLWHRVADTGALGSVMPPGAALGDAVSDILAAWIDDGAVCD